MSEPIKVGDLVMIVRGHGCSLGEVFRVAKFGQSTALYRCKRCNEFTFVKPGIPDVYDAEEGAWVELWRLQRIPDFPELKDERRDEEITA